MIIEFVGTPGAGKTTLMNAAVESLQERGYHAYSANDAARPVAARTLPGRAIVHAFSPRRQRPLLWQLFYAATEAERMRFYWGNRDLMHRVWAYQFRRPISAADRHHVLRWFNHQTGVYEFMRRRAGSAEAVLFDEGFIHRVVQLFASEYEVPLPEAVGAYVALLPRPDLLIYVAVPLEVCRDRVLARGIWERFAVKSATDTDRFLAAAEQAVIMAVAAARERRWPVIELDNAVDDPSPAIDQLQKALADFAPTPIHHHPLPGEI